MARKADSRREPVFDLPADEPDRLDLRLGPDDRPTPMRGPARRRPAGRRDRVEPPLGTVEEIRAPVRAERSDEAPRRRRPEPVDEAEASEDEAPARRERRSRHRGGRPPGGFGWLLRRALYWSLVLGIWAAIAAGGLIVYYGARLPPTSEWAVPKRPANVKIVSADGKLIGNRGDTGGEAVRLSELPPWLPGAVVAIEDRRFRSHFGVDPIGLMRAVVVNLTRRGVSQGGSTLTQQLAKNLFLTQERTFGRKIQEVLLALWLEREHTKDEILELYLNRVYMGAGAYGVDAAARRYFGKSAREVNPMEAAMLAGLLKAPSRYAPSNDPEKARARAEVVLAAMEDTGVLTSEQRRAAVATPKIVYARVDNGSENYVADWVMDQLPSWIGAVDKDIVVTTTIDGSLQMLAEAALQAGLAQFGDRKDVGQGAIVSIDPTGAVKALVGGIDYSKSQFDRATQARRQPGSTFKPFVYLTAMEKGLTPDTVRVDEPFTWKGWSPKNYEKGFKGPVTLKDALAQSINTVAAKLAIEVGPRQVAETAMRLGITSPLTATPSIALGTSEVTPLEITAAFVPFSNGGFGVVPHVVTRITSADGKVLYQRKGSGIGRVIEPGPLAAMNVMLAETLATGTAKKAQIPGWPAAGKTGTSQEFRDAWFIGYTGLLTTGVWLGNDDGTPTKRGTGGTLATVVWQRFMLDAHRGHHAVAIPGAVPATVTAVAPQPPSLPVAAATASPVGSRPRPADPATTGSISPAPREPRTLGDLLGGLFR
ncbi:MAG: PBP1A family penicillin-binding protein [Siculibacillus sp.]|nr:PBP1A family penicillin-binding protein [Siculibacillus sp.]